MDPRLIAYVREQRQNGYSDEQIAEALREQNYPESLVANLLSEAKKSTSADAKLLRSYVASYRSQGQSDELIQQTLLGEGYTQKDIQRALVKPKTHVAPLLLAFPIIALAILGAGFFLIMGDQGSSPAPLPSGTVTQEEVRLSEIIENLIPTASRNPEAALALCERVVEGDRPRCVLAVTRESRSPAYCESVDDEKLRDTCYLEFIYDGHLEFCDSLTQPQNQRYCETVQSLA